MTTFTSDDREEAYKTKVEEAPYHPGYEDAVITPTPKYVGMDPTKMLWKPKPLSDEEIAEIWKKEWQGGNIGHIAYTYARAIEERHGIK